MLLALLVLLFISRVTFHCHPSPIREKKKKGVLEVLPF